MPWKTDINGERKYVPSIYAKEELPTWGEIYGEFYKGHRFYYDPQLADANSQRIDPYWGIPRLKVLLATICNQLNKLLFEDGKLKPALRFINENIMDEAIDLRFTCDLVEPWDYYRIMDPTSPLDLTRLHEGYLENWSTAMNAARIGTSSPHPIYTIPLPTGNPNPFILQSSNVERRDVSKMDGVMCVHPMILFKNPPLKSTNATIYTPRPFDPLQMDDWKKIIDFMFADVLRYFEGKSIGWKGDDGKVVSFNHVVNKCPSGHDPAL